MSSWSAEPWRSQHRKTCKLDTAGRWSPPNWSGSLLRPPAELSTGLSAMRRNSPVRSPCCECPCGPCPCGPAVRVHAVYDTANCGRDLQAGTIGSLGMIKPAIDIRPSLETRGDDVDIGGVLSSRAVGVSGPVPRRQKSSRWDLRICCQGFDSSPVAHCCVVARDGAHARKSKSDFPRAVRIS